MSNKNQYYRQCKYERYVGLAKHIDVSYLPDSLAKVGKKIYFTDKPNEIWTITSVGDRQEERFLKAKEKGNRKFGQSAGLNCA